MAAAALAALGCACQVDRCGGLSIRADCGLEINRNLSASTNRGSAVCLEQPASCVAEGGAMCGDGGPYACGAQGCGLRGCGLRGCGPLGWMRGGAGGGDEQWAAEAAPQQDISKFHPLPTRPVFSPVEMMPAEPPEAAPLPPRPPAPEALPTPAAKSSGAETWQPKPLAGQRPTADGRRSWVFTTPGSNAIAAAPSPMAAAEYDRSTRTTRR
jgi:hypothetical protein